jgi:hypothetical protein
LFTIPINFIPVQDNDGVNIQKKVNEEYFHLFVPVIKRIYARFLEHAWNLRLQKNTIGP